jgi:hypothetical protein
MTQRVAIYARQNGTQPELVASLRQTVASRGAILGAFIVMTLRSCPAVEHPDRDRQDPRLGVSARRADGATIFFAESFRAILAASRVLVIHLGTTWTAHD